MPAKSELKIRVSTTRVRKWCPFTSATVITLSLGVGESQVESHLTKQLGETLLTHPTAAPRPLETMRQEVGRQEVPVSYGALGQVSSLAA